MPNSLRTQIKKLAHDGKITDIECVDLLSKLDGHDEEIRRQTLNEVESAMYHEAFNIDHEVDGMQKWDGGNWIRYKLFEKVMEHMKGETECR